MFLRDTGSIYEIEALLMIREQPIILGRVWKHNDELLKPHPFITPMLKSTEKELIGPHEIKKKVVKMVSPSGATYCSPFPNHAEFS